MTAPSESERAAAMAWLERTITMSSQPGWRDHARTLLAMLPPKGETTEALVNMPEQLDSDALRVFVDAFRESWVHDRSYETHVSVAWRALYAHLSPKPEPKPKPDYYSTVGEKSGVTREVAMDVLRAAADVSRAAETQSPFSVSLRENIK